MPADDVERFEAAAGDLLDELGSPRAVPQPRPEILRHAARLCELFTQNIETRNAAVANADAGRQAVGEKV
jgi:hypothetical protein